MAKVDYFCEESLRKGLKGKTVRGGLVTGGAQVVQIVLTLAAIPTLTRLLSPEDFGLVAMVAVFTNFARMFVDAGLSMATVQRHKITHQQVSNLFWIASSLGIAIALLVVVGSPLVAWVYGEPRLTAITMAMACSYIFAGLAVQPQALLRRGMLFGRLAIVNLVALIAGQGTAILWAWHFQGEDLAYWALVWMPIASSIARAVGNWLACGWLPSLPHRGAGTRSLVTFGANLTGFNFINYFARNTDKLLIGWWWGAVPLGFYERAYKLFMYPLTMISSPLSGVIVPSFSRMADDKERLKQTYHRVLDSLLLVLLPVIAWILTIAEWGVRIMLGPGWEDCVPILWCLAAAGLIQPFSNSTGWLFISHGRTGEMFKTGLVNGSITLVSFAIGLAWGPRGVAASYSVGAVLLSLPYLISVLHKHDMISLYELAKTVRRCALPTIAVMAVNLVLIAAQLPLAMGWKVVISCALSMLVWGLAVLSTPHGRHFLQNLIDLFRAVRCPAQD